MQTNLEEELRDYLWDRAGNVSEFDLEESRNLQKNAKSIEMFFMVFRAFILKLYNISSM